MAAVSTAASGATDFLKVPKSNDNNKDPNNQRGQSIKLSTSGEATASYNPHGSVYEPFRQSQAASTKQKGGCAC